jgi:hypothetical protein
MSDVLARARSKLRRAARRLGLVLLAGGSGLALAGADPQPAARTLASVDGEAITLDDFLLALDSLHGGTAEEAARPRQDPQQLLERLITVKVVAREAREIGFDSREDFVEELEAFRRNTLIDLTLRDRAGQVGKPAPDAVERRYRIAAGEAKVDALHFAKLGDAEAFVSRVTQEGAAFDEVVEEYVRDGRAEGGPGTEFIPLGEVVPAVAGTILDLEPGEIGRPVPLEAGATVVRLVELRVRDDPEARRSAERDVLEAARLKALGAYVDELKGQYARVNQDLLEELDLDVTGEALAALRQDGRAVVEIQGGTPITVGELTVEAGSSFFHGVEKAAREGKLGERMHEALHELILRRVVPLEGRRLGIDGGAEFLGAVRAFEEERLFNAAVRSVVMPEVRVDEAAVLEYYDEHAGEYPGPALVRLDSMAFADREAAERALDRLRRGADWGWTLEHAAGRAQTGPSALIDFRLQRAVDLLPQDLRSDVERAAPGEFLLYAPGGGPAYVLAVLEKPPREPRELSEVRGSIVARLREERARAVLEEWTGQLREASDVRVLVSPSELASLVADARGSGK